MKNFQEQGQTWALEDAISPLYRYRKDWNQSRGDYKELDDMELAYEVWMSNFYDMVQAGLASHKKLEDVLDEIKAEISGEAKAKQDQIEAWAQGEETAIDTGFKVGEMEEMSLDDIGKLFFSERSDDEWG